MFIYLSSVYYHTTQALKYHQMYTTALVISDSNQMIIVESLAVINAYDNITYACVRISVVNIKIFIIEWPED